MSTGRLTDVVLRRACTMSRRFFVFTSAGRPAFDAARDVSRETSSPRDPLEALARCFAEVAAALSAFCDRAEDDCDALLPALGAVRDADDAVFADVADFFAGVFVLMPLLRDELDVAVAASARSCAAFDGAEAASPARGDDALSDCSSEVSPLGMSAPSPRPRPRRRSATVMSFPYGCSTPS